MSTHCLVERGLQAHCGAVPRAPVKYSSAKPREGTRRLQEGIEPFAFLRVPSWIGILDRRASMGWDAMLESFRVARYRFDLEAVEEWRMPAYQGRTLRGGFGHAFKRMLCMRPDWGACTPCAMGNGCPYRYI